MGRIRNVTVIGAGNMGSAIAGGLLRHSDCRLSVANRGQERLDRFDERYKDYSERYVLSQDFSAAVKAADLVIIAVKPWAFDDVMKAVTPEMKNDSIILSVAAGCGLEKMRSETKESIGKIYMIPNTAILIGKGMSFAATEDIDDTWLEDIVALFSPITRLEIIDESMMPAAMALCSCGIAYVYKFIAAAAQAGVELGFHYDDAVEYFTATVAGAAAMLEECGKSPQSLINEVTTPGGITIKGINKLESKGFPSAVIEAITTSTKA